MVRSWRFGSVERWVVVAMLVYGSYNVHDHVCRWNDGYHVYHSDSNVKSILADTGNSISCDHKGVAAHIAEDRARVIDIICEQHIAGITVMAHSKAA